MECPSCNAYNPDGLISCTVCGAHLPKSNPVAAMAKPKLAIFHVEEAVLDNAAGERVAKRKGLKGKRFEREVAANLEKSVSRAGVRDYINKLSRDNFTIAFISSLDSSYQFRLQDRLRQLGYPVMADDSGPLVLMGSSQDNIRSLAKRYDINFAFGTSGAGTAKQLNVPGVYATVSDYIGNASNPYIAPQATPSPYSLSGLRPEPTPSTYTLANPSNCGCGQDPCITYGPMANPTSGFTERMYLGDSGDEAADAAFAYSTANNVILWFQATAAGDKTHYYGYTSVDDAKNDRSRLPKEPSLVAPKFKLGLKREEALRKAEEIATTTGKPLYVAQEYAVEELEHLGDPYVGFHYLQAFELLYPVDAPIRVDPIAKGGFMGSTVANPLKNAPFDIKDAASMTEAERQAALRQYQSEQFALRQAEQARRDAEVAAESARKARLAANTPLLKSSIKRWAETYLDPQMPQIIAEMKKPPHFSAYAPIGTGDGFRGEALTILKDIHQNSRDAGFDMYAYLSDLYGVNVSLSFHGRWGADRWKIKFDDNPAGYSVPPPMPPMPPMTNPPPKPRRQTSKKTGKKRRESAKKYFDRLMGNKMMNKEFPDNSQRSAVALRYVKEEYGQRGVNSVTKTWSPMDNPRKNPASPKKLKKAKDAYKKFHGGKTPDEIRTEKIDVGNVWYSLGECWTIGYMSPKENGNEHQKFIHEMNEESKDGNYPILYATMPEDGEPMLIIKGGSMKIGMRDGKAWLID